MPSIRVTMPDGASFNVDAPGFATEVTLNQILRAITGQTNGQQNTAKVQKANASATQGATSSLEDLTETIDLTGDSFNSAANSTFSWTKALDSAASIMDQASESIQSLAFSGNDSHGKLNQLSNMAGKLSESLSEITEGIPIVSTFAKAGDAVVQGVGIVVGFVTNTLDNLRDSQRSLYQSSVFFAEGIDTASRIAGEAGLTIGAMARAAQASEESLRRSSGGAANALTKVVKSFGILKNQVDGTNRTYAEQLYALGYTQDEILSGIASFNASVDMSGQTMNAKQLADASMSYLKNLKELDRLTGEDAATRQRSAEALRNELAFRQYLQTLQGPEADAVTQLVSSLEAVNPQMAQLAKYQLMGVHPTDQALAAIEAQMPGFSAVMAQARQDILAGSFSAMDATEVLKLASKTGAAEIDAFADSLGGYQQLAYIEQSTSIMKNILDVLGPAYDKFDKVAKAADVDSTVENITQNLGPLSEALARYTKIEVEISAMMQTAAQQITKSVTEFASEVEKSFKEMLNTLGFGDDNVLIAIRKREELSALQQQELTQKWTKIVEDQTKALENNEPIKPLTIEEQTQIIMGVDPSGTNSQILMPGINFDEGLEGKASGGEVARGETYLVGEEGPEVITAPSPGQAYANDDPIAVKISDTSDFRSMVEQLEILTKLNQAMLRQMERGNTLAQQNGLVAS